METRDTPSSAPSSKHTREKLFLVEQAATKDLRVLPGKEWALHYPGGGSARAEKLQGLLDGRYEPEDAAGSLKPDALIYKTDDLDEHGLEHVSARVRDISSRIAHYDYERFAHFVAGMKGKDANLETVQKMYDGIAGSRIRKQMIDAYGFTGRQQMETALKNEAEDIPALMDGLPRVNKILEALKLNWLCEDLRLARTEQRDAASAKLTKEEEMIFAELSDSYRKYAQTGDPKAYADLVNGVRNTIPQLEKESETSGGMERLKEELEQYKDEVGPPGTPQDPAIPPEDSDEYHTSPPPLPGESKEKAKSRPIFEITPAGTSKGPLTGEYCSGRKSYFDIDRKTWSKRKRLTPYTASIAGEKRQTISGTVDAGLKSIPIPNHYALDVSSLQYSGARPEFLRDQNGCFYIQSSGNCSFSIDFLQESPPHIGPPVAEDTQSIYRGSLSAKTEAAIAGLAGSPSQKAEQAQAYILKNHFYPGGGDLDDAQALQHKLRTESTGDNYLQNLDASEYLECYSANTLFTAMMRKAGVPARLVTGHKIDQAHAGKAAIDASTGHAWSEIWDGSEWRRVDATPPPKPQDKKKDSGEKEKLDGTPTEKADDGGMEQPGQPGEDGEPGGEPGEEGDVTGQTQKSVDKTMEQFQEKSGDKLDEASDQEKQESERDVEESKQEMQRMEEQKKEMAEQIEKAENFGDLKKEQDKLEKDEMLDEEMKKDLEEKLEAKEKEMKEEMKDRLDQMAEDGFLDADAKDKLMEDIDKKNLEELDRIKKQMETENRLYDEYENIREEVLPLVEEWYRYFVEWLPRETSIETDEDSLTRQGAFNPRSVHRPRNLLLGLIKNPRIIKPSVKPRFLAFITLDISGSMAGEKLRKSRKLLVFFSEFFSRINREFGYIRFSIVVFSDSVTEIKSFRQNYISAERYDFGDGTESTVKVRLMQQVHAGGGTNMLAAVQKAARDLNEETFQYPNFASAFYFIGDGGDTCGNAENARKFMECNDSEHGFGKHMKSAIFLGDESQRQTLAAIFGEENTTVAPDFDELVRQSMEKFASDIGFYMRDKANG